MAESSQLEHQFLQWLDLLIEQAERSQQENVRRGEHFEAILDRIRGNVASIYRRMFVLGEFYPHVRGVERR